MEDKIWTIREFYEIPFKNRTGLFNFVGGYIRWYKEGKYHRLDGPAIEDIDGYKEWYIEGKQYTEEEFNIISFAILNNLEKLL